MICARALLAAVLLFPLAEAYAADWQYAGNVGKDQASFFDAAGVQYPDKDTVRIWVKYIPEKTIKSYLNSKDREQVIEESALKMASGYIPVFIKLESIKRTLPDNLKMQDALATMISDEIIANKSDVLADTTTYFEIDCKGKRIAPLTIIKYRKNGGIAKSEIPKQAKYFYIVPDSSGDWLAMLVCPKS
jgi:hypothetical protein